MEVAAAKQCVNTAMIQQMPIENVVFGLMSGIKNINLTVIRHYLAALSGAGGRVVISLFYFISLANALTVAEFGLFATASAAGVVLSRIVGFGFTSPLYRAATVKPRLIGLFSGGYLFFSALSLPIFALLAWLTHKLFFGETLALSIFLLIVVTEALIWRTTEVIIIVNNGLNNFGRASTLVILGTAVRAAAAIIFALFSSHGLLVWALYYLAANLISLLIGLAFFVPKMRLRFKPALYKRHISDSVSVAAAEILFYVQSELDKLLVLALGGAQTAGIYAIIIRLVDLTAIPIRTFNMMLVQKMMRDNDLLKSSKRRVGMELGLFVVSTIGFAVLAVFLHFFPNALGKNVSTVTSLLFIVLLVPGFRNLVEYHAELLYARGQTALRALNLGLLAGVKAVALAVIFTSGNQSLDWLAKLNYVYALIWIASVALTYSAMRSRRTRPDNS
jgi:O-antigen/teichoic acid export membrane protein